MMDIPLVTELERPPSPAETARRAARFPHTVWLDSALRASEIGRYSFLAVDPFLVLRSWERKSELIRPDGRRISTRPALAELSRNLQKFQLNERVPGIPFQGGAAGYFGYELGRQLEDVPRSRWRDLPLPEMVIGFYDAVLGWDHQEGRAWLISTGRPSRGAEAVARAKDRMSGFLAWIRGEGNLEPRISADEKSPFSTTARAGAENGVLARDGPPSVPVPGRPGLYSTFSPEKYAAGVRRAVEYIVAGDIFQVNLSQRFHTRLEEPPFRLYRRLRTRNPAPFAAFMTTPSCTIAGASPERFLKVERDGTVETRPIKGTRPRGRNPRHDMHLKFELADSAKDRAENLMIVDLLRNDLSRVCRPGTVRVPTLFRKETYATVHHLVSIVAGRLEDDRSRVDLLGAAFPGGSVTGAPKIRAMEIIAELEPVCRGPYCGCLGYLGFDGSMDTSITIRTLVASEDHLHFHAGGAVVADSDPREEYQETLDKAAGMIQALDLDPAARGG